MVAGNQTRDDHQTDGGDGPRSTRPDPTVWRKRLPEWLPGSGRRSSRLAGTATRTRAARRTQELLAGGQIAMAVVLMSAAGLLARSFAALTAVDPAFGSRGPTQALVCAGVRSPMPWASGPVGSAGV